jgi:hypothetical protein
LSRATASPATDLVERRHRQHAHRLLLRAVVAARGDHDRVEFAEPRYAALPPSRARYLGLPINLSSSAGSTGDGEILSVTVGWDRLTAVLASLASGLLRLSGSGVSSSPTSSSSRSR